MPDNTISFQDFSKRLWLAGSRETIPRNALRRCVGCAPEPEPLVKSRWGSTLRFAVPNVISMGCYFDSHFLYDGVRLWQAALSDPHAVVVDTGYDGNRVTMIKAPPAFGVPDWLFIIGGGRNRKISPTNVIQNWGIDKPVSHMAGHLVAQNRTVIDSFDGSAANWFTVANCTDANEGGIVHQGAGSLKILPDGFGIAPWSITRFVPLNLSTYASGDISLQTDYISFWVNLVSPTTTIWLTLEFDVNAGDFIKDYYSATIQVVPATSNINAAASVVILDAVGSQWIQVAIAKSQFARVGSRTDLDWSNVVAIRFRGGNPLVAAPVPVLYVDYLTMFGGQGLGTGPAALTGGSTLKYLVTFGNNETGNDSNPCDHATIVAGIAEQAVVLSTIPLSPDPQVGNRKLWRTSEGGETYSFLDIIPDNVTTTYTDHFASLPGQPIIVTPWVAAVTVAVGYYIDSGTGYYMRCSVGGATSAAPPVWNLPDTDWAGLATFDTLGERILPRSSTNKSAFQVSHTGISGIVEPRWNNAPAVGNTIIDGTVTWTNIGTLSTVDNLATWVTQGLNSLPSLGTDQVQRDNSLFPLTCGDAAFFQGSMFVTRDSTPGNQSYIYVSTPGKSEGYANIVRVGSEDDPMQKLVVWDQQLWAFTSRYVYPLTGTPPDMTPGERSLSAEGTSWPYTVIPTPYGVVYRAVSGVRLFNNATNDLIGYDAIGPSERGQTVENVPPFQPTIAALMREEVVFSDGVDSFAVSMVPGSSNWRMLGLGFNAVIYHDEIQVIHAAVAGAVYDYEVPGVTDDNGTPIGIEWQLPSTLIDGAQLTMTKRLYLDADLAGQVLTPTLLVDNADIPLPLITNASRSTIPIPWQANGRVIGLRLTGNVVQRVTLFGVSGESRNGR